MVSGGMTEPIPAQEDQEAPIREEKRPLRALLPRGTEAAVVGMVGAFLGAASLVSFGVGGRGLIGLVLCPTLVLLTDIDLRHRLLPNLIVLPAAAAVTVIVAVSDPGSLAGHAIAGGAYAGVMLIAALVFPAGLGMGDVKLALLIGLALGGKTGAAIFVTAIVSFVVSLALLVRGGRAALRQSVPFGPFLAAGALVGFFFG
jgi:leader peptidase (prepilin peptidase)/N-methyltransferase